MKKIILSMALITGSLTAFGQDVTGEIFTTDGRDMVMPGDNVEILILSTDDSGINAVDVLSGAQVRISASTPFEVGELVYGIVESPAHTNLPMKVVQDRDSGSRW